MTNNYAVLVSLGFCQEDYKFENFKSNFGYDWSKEDLEETLECAGNPLAESSLQICR